MEWKSLLMVLLVLENVTQQFAEKRSCPSKNSRNKISSPQRQQRSNVKLTAATAIKRNSEAVASYRYRYRLQSSKCRLNECDRYHRHLLLITNSIYRDVLKECSSTVYIRDLVDLSRHLCETTSAAATLLALDTATKAALIIVHSDATYLDIIKIMIACLGNVSVYVDDYIKYLDAVSDCEKTDYCTNLFSLSPVIEQSKRWRSASTSSSSSFSPSDSLSSTYLDMYDKRWLPITSDSKKLTSPNAFSFADLQIRLLASPMCARSRRFNLFYEIAPAVVSEVTTATSTSTEHRLYENVNESELEKLDYEKDKFNSDEDDEITGYPKEYRLELEDILPSNPSNYDKNRAPRMRNQPTLVDFHVTVLSIDSINEESMTYVADIFLAQSWRDQRLRLPDSASMGEYRILNVDWLHEIWKPDSFFKNAKQVTFHEISVPNHYLWLYHDKTLLYMSKLNLVLSCAMKFESYPHDTQICSMMIESLSHTTQDLIFRWNATDPLVVNPAIELPQLDIANNYTDDCTIEYSTGNFTCLSVVFNLKRRLGYHLFHTYIPSALIVVMSWISFWINPEAIPARVTLGVTSLLTLATQNTQSQQSLPPVSYVKAVDIWMSSCSVFVFLSLMEFAIVNNYMGPVATKVMRGYSLSDMQITDDVKGLQSGNEENTTRNPVPPGPQFVRFRNGKAVALCIDKFSRIFFPFSFIVLNIAYWTAFLR